MRFGSLFSGIGGFDLGLEQAGMECAWQVEIDRACQRLLAARWPSTYRRANVKGVGGGNLEKADLVCGGFPCQDLSVAGSRAGLAGERSGLWFEFHRILAGMRPDWCLIENVPGLLSSNGGQDFACILQGLADLGYGVAWRVLDAEYFGVAQRRRRVFIVGHLGDGRAAEVLFEPESLSGDSAPGGETRERIAAGALSRSLSRVGGGDDPGANKGTPLVFEPRFARNDRGGPDVIVPPLKAMSGRSGKGDGAPLVFDARGNGDGETVSTLTGDHGDRVTDYTPVVAVPLRSRQSTKGIGRPGRGGEDDSNLVAYPDPAYSVNGQGSKFGSGRHNQDTFVVGPLAPNAGPRSHDAGNFHSNQGVDAGHVRAAGHGVRRLTPTECERLQGFPDGWTAGFPDSSRYRMLGNAVCVPVAEWIGRRICAAASAERSEA